MRLRLRRIEGRPEDHPPGGTLAGLLAACIVAVSALVACGSDTAAPTASLPTTSTVTPGGGLPNGWEPPSAEVLAAFSDASADLPCPLYLPTLVPSGAHTVAVESGDPAFEVGAELAVHLAVGEGTIHVWEGIAADVGDVPGEACGTVNGRPAVAYSVLGGLLVQWSDQGWWYGVFSRDVSKETLIGVAQAMTDGGTGGS